jgi:hypothetical protein
VNRAPKEFYFFFFTHQREKSMKWQAYMYTVLERDIEYIYIGYRNWLARMSPACRDGVQQQSLVRN